LREVGSRIRSPPCRNVTPGRFNTTPGGKNWWQSSTDFTLTFDHAISAFGFYGTDSSDFGGGLSLELLSGTDVLSTLIVKNPGASLGASGSLLFFGFLDTTQAYTGIRFVVQQTGTEPDVLGFDDLIAVDSPTRTVPEPSTLVLAARGSGAGRPRSVAGHAVNLAHGARAHAHARHAGPEPDRNTRASVERDATGAAATIASQVDQVVAD
jgi:hypothetical protein